MTDLAAPAEAAAEGTPPPPAFTPAPSESEVELKFHVHDRGTAEAVLRSTKLGGLEATGGRPRVVRMEDRYVDTAAGALRAAGYAVRMRQTANGTIVSVKGLESVAEASGATRRVELEGPAKDGTPPADWPPSNARALVLNHAGARPLETVLILRQLRHKRIYRSTTARVEVSLDDIEVVVDGAVIGRFTELEAELAKGDPAALAPLAAELVAAPGLRAATISKLAMALSIRDGGEVPDDLPVGPRLALSDAPGVTADDHVAEAGRKILRFHLARMLDHEPGSRSGEDMENVHKMRVATRRQRAAWRVFGEAYRAGPTKRYRDGLRNTARRLGAVRDLDVQLEAIDTYRADLPLVEQRSLEPLIDAWHRQRAEARIQLVRELDSNAHRRWVEEAIDFVQTGGASSLPVGPVEPHRIRDTAPSRIWAAYEAVRAYEPALRWADIETLHDLRIAGKWLRYSLEFVREALGPESTPLIERVTALQDHLGLMQDASVTAAMARTFLVESTGRLSAQESAAIGRYLVGREREVARLRRTLGPAWRGVAGVRVRRGLGRVVACL
jgi:CHAD domain-containing protein/adenylate cyclase class IV